MADEAPKETVPELKEVPKEENVESENRVEQVTQKLETVTEEKVEEKSSKPEKGWDIRM